MTNSSNETSKKQPSTHENGGNSTGETASLADTFSILNSEVSQLWRQYIPLLRADVLIGSFMINILGLGLPVVTLQVYDRIIPNNALETLTYLVVGLIVVIMLDLILKISRSWLAGWAGAQYEHQAGLNAMNKLMRGNLEKIESVPAGVHLDRIGAIEPVRDFYASQASLSLIDLPFVVIFLAVMAYIAGWLVLVPIALLIFAIYVARTTGAGLRGALVERSTWDDRRYNFLIEALSGIHTIKSMAMERLILRRYERLMKSSVTSGYSVAFFSGFAQNIGSTISQVTMAAVAGIGSILVVNTSMSIGALAACTLLAGRVVQPVLKAMSLWTRFQTVTISEAKLAEMDLLEPCDGADATEAPIIRTLELENASFRYSDEDEDILHSIDLSLQAGEIIGISGGNGSGKTTLLHMLLGRLEPTGGSFKINGEDGSKISNELLRQQIAYLSQKPVLFQGSVLENLTMFDLEHNLDKALILAEKLGLDMVFARQPEGYDTPLGDTAGSAIPGGVAQRINMVRALVNEPNVILFDEANASLDSSSETQLRHLLQEYKGKATIVIVTYRPSLLALADRRFLLDSGTLSPMKNVGRNQPDAKSIAPMKAELSIKQPDDGGGS